MMCRNYGRMAGERVKDAFLLIALPWLIWWDYPEPEFLAWFGLVMGIMAIILSIMFAILWLAGEQQ